MLNRIIPFIQKKFNTLFLFSVSYYVMTIISMFSKDIAENTILPISNAINDYQPIYWMAGIAIAYSLFKNYRLVKSGKQPIYRMFWRSGIELQIMLWGTLASLMFSLGSLFSESIEIKIVVAVLAGIMIGLNIERDKIVEWMDKKWINFTMHR